MLANNPLQRKVKKDPIHSHSNNNNKISRNNIMPWLHLVSGIIPPRHCERFCNELISRDCILENFQRICK